MKKPKRKHAGAFLKRRIKGQCSKAESPKASSKTNKFAVMGQRWEAYAKRTEDIVNCISSSDCVGLFCVFRYIAGFLDPDQAYVENPKFKLCPRNQPYISGSCCEAVLKLLKPKHFFVYSVTSMCKYMCERYLIGCYCKTAFVKAFISDSEIGITACTLIRQCMWKCI